jgi:hypothetical protein
MNLRIFVTTVSRRIPRSLSSLFFWFWRPTAGTVQITRRLVRQETRAPATYVYIYRVPRLPRFCHAIAQSYVTIVPFALRAQADLARKRGRRAARS